MVEPARWSSPDPLISRITISDAETGEKLVWAKPRCTSVVRTTKHNARRTTRAVALDISIKMKLISWLWFGSALREIGTHGKPFGKISFEPPVPCSEPDFIIRSDQCHKPAQAVFQPRVSSISIREHERAS